MNDLIVRAAAEEDRPAWDAFVGSRDDAEAGHLWAFGSLVARVFGPRLHRLTAFRGDRVVGVLPLVFQCSLVGRFLTSVPYLNYAGVLSDDAEARMALAQAARDLSVRLRAHRLELRGRSGDDLPIPVWEGKHAYVLDLSEGAEHVFSSLKAKVRSQVRRPGKEGYTSRVVDDADAGLDLFYPLLARRWHELGSPVLPRRFFRELHRTLPEAIDYVVVEKGTHVAAAGVLLRAGAVTEIPWAASATEDNRFGVNMLLYWQGIEHAANGGALRFDMGRSTPGTGNARFKLQWGAQQQPLLWNVESRKGQGTASERGSASRGLVASAWRRLPQAVAGWLGPPLAARIPY